MDTTLMQQLAKRVVAWHNRHPLAKRITLAQVRSIGVVSLPFAQVSDTPEVPAPDAAAAPSGRLATLRARLRGLTRLTAALKLRRRRPTPEPSDGLRAVFDEDFIGSLPDGEVRRWAEQHARSHRPGEESWPQRDVAVDARWADQVPAATAAGASASPTADLADLIADLSDRIDAASGEALPERPERNSPREADPESHATSPPSELRFALTAAVEVGGARHRLLLDSAPKSPVLGRRAFSPLRIALASALLSGLCAAALLVPRLGRHPATPPGASAHANAASAAGSAAAAGHGAASAAHGPTQAVAASAAASGASQAAPADADHGHAKGAHGDGHATADHAGAGAGAGAADEAASSAAHAGPVPATAPASASTAAATKGPEISAAPPGAHSTGHAAAKPTLPVPAGAPPPAPGPVFALVSRSSTSRGEPLVALERMQQAAAPLADKLPGTRTELVENGGRWSAIWWPFRSREDATQARWALALKGVTVELVEF